MSYAAAISVLIDKQDTIEIVAERIAEMIKAESVAQMALAVAGGKDPALWDLRVFRERAYPWESWHAADDEDQRPIVNVCVVSTAIDLSGSDVSRRQRYVGRIGVDVYGRGLARDDGAFGQVPGDVDAASVRDRGCRLVRNILAASTSTYLGLRGTAPVHGGPLVTGCEYFDPDFRAERGSPCVRAVRLTCEVGYNEESPQYVPEPLEYLGITVTRHDDGELYAVFEVDYAP